MARLKIEGEMVRGRFLSRTSRFSVIAEVADGGEAHSCHLPNPGRLRELLVPGAELLLRPAGDRHRRKTKLDVFAAVADGETIVVDSRVANQILRGALSSGELPEFAGWKLERSEPARGRSRLDFLLAGERPCLLEAKSCTLVRDGIALFPDAPTERGRRHLQELAGAHREGYRASIVFVVMRGDASTLMPNDDTDPAFGAALREAVAGGVEAIALAARYRDGWIELTGRVAVDLSGLR
ncbi:MAG: putative DNA-binding transcriptional regulator [Methanosaeta sp. PtaU1.Bin055]|nr:MAG: putative DNA-binding transcriptional regulator [Methanosaeta sp. PtaU1.Bin055]